MGILATIQAIKDKVKKGTGQGEDYIPVEKLNTRVQVIREEKKTIGERLSDLKAKAKTKKAELDLYRKEREEKKRAELKQKISDTADKVKLANLENKLQTAKNSPVKQKGKLKLQNPGTKPILNEPFPGGKNPFG